MQSPLIELRQKIFITAIAVLLLYGCASAPPESKRVVFPDSAAGVVQERLQRDVIVLLNPFPAEAEGLAGVMVDDIAAASGLLVDKETQILQDRFMVTAREGERIYIHCLNDPRAYYGRGHKVELAFPQKKLAVVDFAAPAGKVSSVRQELQTPLMNYLKSCGHYTIIEPALTAAALADKTAAGGFFLEAPQALELGRRLGADLVFTAQASLDAKGEWVCQVRLFQVSRKKLILDKTYR